MDTMDINRSLTITFNLLSVHGSLNNKKVLDSIKESVSEEDIVGIQLTRNACNITLKNTESKEILLLQGVNIDSYHIKPVDIENPITTITIKDLPVEIPDQYLVSKLEAYGQVIQGSVDRRKIKGTNVENGTRIVQLLSVKQIIPNELKWGRFNVRIFCDNGKSKCLHCDSVDHPHYQCQYRQSLQKQCFKCGETGHVKRNCPQEESNINSNSDHITGFRGASNPLSNFYRLDRPIKVYRKELSTVEHGYKIMKIQHYGRTDLKETILATESPLEVMRVVRSELQQTEIDQDNENDWKDKRLDIMKKLLDQKYRVCKEFRDALHTSNEIICEATSHPFWGTGLAGIERSVKCEPAEWPGQNKLGELLMQLRKENAVAWQIENEAEESSKADTETAETTKRADQTGEQQNHSIEYADEFVEDEEEDDEIEQQEISVIIGDSILHGGKVDDGILLQTKPGAKLKDTEEMLIECMEKTEGAEISNVVIALGTNDISNSNSANSTIISLQQTIATVVETCNQATIHVSSITPRTGKQATNINKTIDTVNSFMAEFCKTQDRIHYIRNQTIFTDKKIAASKIFNPNDKSGTHLSNLARAKVIQNIVDCVNKPADNKTPKTKRPRSVGTPSSQEKSTKHSKKNS